MIHSSKYSGGVALGTIVQGYGLPEPNYVACNGRPLAKADYPRLASLFPIGRFTGTVRALVTTSAYALVAASPNYFVASVGSSSTTVPFQYSADGATYSNASVVAPSMTINSLIFAGTRWLASGVSGSAPIATTGDNPNSTWAALTGGVSGGVQRYGIAYSPSLGRAAFVAAGATSTIHTLENGATALVARTLPSSLTRSGICWSGAYFITLNGASISRSPDGITGWVDEPLPEAASGSGGITSNGAGVVLISGVASGLLVSFDHGATFNRAAIPGVPADNTWLAHYSVDRFFVPTTLGVAMSLDGKAWFLEPQLVQARLVTSMFAKKGSTFAQVQSTSATAYSFTESATHFNAPLIQAFAPVASGNPIPLAPSFIKAL